MELVLPLNIYSVIQNCWHSMNNKILVSVIIPTKGRLQFVKSAVNSIYTQSGINLKNIEIIVIDEKNYNGQIINHLKRSYPEITVLENRDNEGPGGSRNTGLSIAKGKYIVFLDSDDQMKPEFLCELGNELEQNSKLVGVICYSNATFDTSFKLIDKFKLYLLMTIRDFFIHIFYVFNRKYLYPAAFYLCQISHMMFKASIVKNLSFDYSYRRGGEDWDFVNRLLYKGPIGILPKRLLLFRYSQNSSTGQEINKQLKWQSYMTLASSLKPDRTGSIFFKLFLRYIKIFRYP